MPPLAPPPGRRYPGRTKPLPASHICALCVRNSVRSTLAATAGSSNTVATRTPFFASVAPRPTKPSPASAANKMSGAGSDAPFRRQDDPGDRDRTTPSALKDAVV